MPKAFGQRAKAEGRGRRPKAEPLRHSSTQMRAAVGMRLARLALPLACLSSFAIPPAGREGGISCLMVPASPA
jgi:hypothetical protein